MKFFLSLAFNLLLTALASAAPYIVYTGVGNGTSFSATGTGKASYVYFLITNVADTSSFTIIRADTTTKILTMISRPSASSTDEESNTNFLGGLLASTAKSGLAVFSYSDESTDSDNTTRISHAYATGALVMNSITLAAARTKPLVVNQKFNGVANGTYTFSTLTPAITTGANPIPTSLTGTFSDYAITASGELTNASTQGTLTLTKNATFTSLANIGGSFTSGKSTFAIVPVSYPGPLGNSEAEAAASWVFWIAQDSGYHLPISIPQTPQESTTGGTISLRHVTQIGNTYIPLRDTSGSDLTVTSVGSGTPVEQGAGGFTISGANSYTGTTAINSGTLYTGSTISINGGSNIVGTTSGTLTLNGTNTYSGATVLNSGSFNLNVGDIGTTLTLGSGTIASDYVILGGGTPISTTPLTLTSPQP